MLKRGVSANVVIIFLILFFTSIVIAPPPITNVNTQVGLEIFYQAFEFKKQNEPFKLHIHVTNISNGIEFLNTEIDCYLHLYNGTGSHIFEGGPMSKDSNGQDLEQFIGAGNFSSLGLHAFYIYCNNTAQDIGGAVKGVFEVTPTGENLSTADSLNYIIILVFAFILFLGAIYVFYVTPFSDEINDLGHTIYVNKAKYVKLFFVPISYLLFIWVLNLLLGLANNYLSSGIFAGYITMMFNLFILLGYPLLVIWLVGFFIQLFKDIHKANIIKQLGAFK